MFSIFFAYIILYFKAFRSKNHRLPFTQFGNWPDKPARMQGTLFVLAQHSHIIQSVYTESTGT